MKVDGNMIVRYLKNELFSDSEEECIEIRIENTHIQIESVIQADSGCEAIQKFFQKMLEEKTKGNILQRVDMVGLKKYALQLFQKRKNSRGSNYSRYGYFWRMDEIESSLYLIYLELNFSIGKKYFLPLEKMIKEGVQK